MSLEQQRRKTKLLYIKEILERYTDADHDITQAEIQEKLEKIAGLSKADAKDKLMAMTERDIKEDLKNLTADQMKLRRFIQIGFHLKSSQLFYRETID